MAGTSIGGKAAAKVNKEKYGDNFYSEIGKIGGSVLGVNKGFAQNRELAKEAGAKGGRNSKRTFTEQQKEYHKIKMKNYWKKRREAGL